MYRLACSPAAGRGDYAAQKRDISGYDVGALLYCPANAHQSIADALRDERYPKPFSLAFCLEDTVAEGAVEEAEEALFRTLEQISRCHAQQEFYLPLIFIRVRSPQQLKKLAERYSPFTSVLRGFILPKFFVDNCVMPTSGPSRTFPGSGRSTGTCLSFRPPP